MLGEEAVVVFAVRVRLDRQRNDGADLRLFGGGEGVALASVGLPEPGFLAAIRAREHAHVRSDHKGGVEAYAELADDVHRVPGVVLLFERKRAALGDGAEVFVQLLLRHADAVVAHAERARGFVNDEANLKIVPRFADFVVRQREEVELVHRVAGVADELAQEDFLMRVDGVDHEVEDPPRFRFELFFCHGSAPPVII